MHRTFSRLQAQRRYSRLVSRPNRASDRSWQHPTRSKDVFIGTIWSCVGVGRQRAKRCSWRGWSMVWRLGAAQCRRVGQRLVSPGEGEARSLWGLFRGVFRARDARCNDIDRVPVRAIGAAMTRIGRFGGTAAASAASSTSMARKQHRSRSRNGQAAGRRSAAIRMVC